jgi:hypothetical protein
MRARASLVRLGVVRFGLGLMAGAGLFAASLAPASAQVFFRPFAHRFSYEMEGPYGAPPPMMEERALGPRAIVMAAGDQGWRVLSRPIRNRDVYVMEAQDSYGRRARLVIDAYDGTVLQRTPHAAILTPAPRYAERDFEDREIAPRGRDPRVIDGVGPRRAEPQKPAQRRPSQAAAPTRPNREAPEQAVTPPPSARPERPATPTRPPVAAAPAAPSAQPDAPAKERPAPRVIPLPTAPSPAAEAPGPIPPPPQIQAQPRLAPAQAPAPQAAPPVTPLDDVPPAKPATPAVPAAGLE